MIDIYTPPPEIPQCVVEAAQTYNLPIRGLIALWLTEGGRTGMQNLNKNETYDFGPMQINTVWADKLAKDFNVTSEMLTKDFCWSVKAASYILRYEINLAGGNFWEGVGHYHSRTDSLKKAYIERVYKNSKF